ncbi:hypothetical protein FLJC2902T_08590 [Flavobacterium limnosediminis JC2902]|uniref:Glutaminyl-tRNA synthetase n=1 Tax=Flavobacterium limnosediminis JC2902 TaxID=1341181 RepID=V6SYF9_9FLAO|nr:DUF6370 family protein [Flavobacterium limnosediminis]ESU29455.1 hypothetical protein FLJC2902T_08590 [Flavobacterium limnosediminis JC2902]
MKNIFVTLLFLSTAALSAQEKKEKPKTQIVEASCGQCQFGMKAKGCDLAVRINGKTYFVDGTTIDQHGDAHAEDGFCNTIHKAEVSGVIKNDRFKVTTFRLVEEKK